VIALDPFARVVDENCAVACANSVLGFTPPATGTAEPRGEPLRKNCTVPVGSCKEFAVALLMVDTVADSVTLVPGATVVWLGTTEIVVDAFETTMTAVTGPLGLKLGSPR
jgi:hypothetical protein